MLVMCAYTPLKSVELLRAIRLDSNSDILHLSEDIDEDLLLDLCNNLLVLDSQRKVWRFSHLSVTEYFEENHWSLRQAHCYTAKICLRLLMEIYKEPRKGGVDNSDNGLDDELKRKGEPHDIFDPKHPLQEYCRHHWITHVQTQEEQEADPVLADLLKAFLGSPGESSVHYRRWYRNIVSDSWERPSSSIFSEVDMQEIFPEVVAMFAICRFSFYTLLRDWWDNVEINLSQINARGHNLLVLAAAAGSKPICESLINQGILVNTLLRSGYYASALVAATWWVRTEIVKFLVQKGADVNMPLHSGNYGSALAVAARWG